MKESRVNWNGRTPPSTSIDSGSKWSRAAESMVPAERETSESKILFNSSLLRAMAKTPIKEPELMRVVAKMTDRSSFGMSAF